MNTNTNADTNATNRITRRVAFAAAAIFVLLGATGCGRSDGLNRVAVFGRVTLDGKPLSGATISFCPTPPTVGPLSSTAVIDGKFQFTRANGPIAGQHKVHIRTQIEDHEPIPGEPIVPPPVDPIPIEYHDETILVAEISHDSAEDELEFHLKSKPAAAGPAGSR